MGLRPEWRTAFVRRTCVLTRQKLPSAPLPLERRKSVSVGLKLWKQRLALNSSL